jgi:hypothetical protein
MSDLTHTHQRNPAHPNLGRPLDEPLVPSPETAPRDSVVEGSPDNVPGYEQMESTYNEGSAESAQGAYPLPLDDVSTFVVPDRIGEDGIPADPLNQGQGRPMQ